MNIDLDVLFPDGLSDETAAVVADVLADLLMWWKAHYLVQIRRRYCNLCALSDPEEGPRHHHLPPRANPCPADRTGRVLPEPPRDVGSERGGCYSSKVPGSEDAIAHYARL